MVYRSDRMVLVGGSIPPAITNKVFIVAMDFG